MTDIRCDRSYYLCNCLNEWNEVSFSQYFSVNSIVAVWMDHSTLLTQKYTVWHGQQGQRSVIETWSNWRKMYMQYKNWQNGTERTKCKLVRTACLEESLCGWVVWLSEICWVFFHLKLTKEEHVYVYLNKEKKSSLGWRMEMSYCVQV